MSAVTPDMRAAPTAADATNPQEPVDALSLAALTYLALPVLIFFGGWMRPVAAIVLDGLVLLGLVACFRFVQAKWQAPCPRCLLAIVAVALAWTCLGGAGHFFYANTYDWGLRDAILRDLVVNVWPIKYGEADGLPMLLRAPLAYYLPAAVLGKLFGLGNADLFLWAWTVAGVVLLLLLLPLPKRSFLRFLIGLAVVVMFSGMDAGGLWANGLSLPMWGSHLEWWTRQYQYSSHSTLLFWVPNHALPGWLAAALFLRHWKHPIFLAVSPLLAALVPLWSPFALIGIAPFLALSAGYAVKTGAWRGLRVVHVLPAAVVLGVAVLYLTMDVGGIPSFDPHAAAKGRPGEDARWLFRYIMFVSFEFGILAFVLLWVWPSAPLWVATGVLLALPMFSFGPGNDLVMRASVPALLVLCASCLTLIDRDAWRGHMGDAVALAVILPLGAITPINEMVRALDNSRWEANLERGILDTQPNRSRPPHYMARLNRPLLAWLLKPPVNADRL